MLRIFTWIMASILALISILLLLIFTETGNNLLKTPLQHYLQQRVEQARINQLEIRLDHSDIDISLNQDTHLALHMMTNWLSRTALGQWQFITTDMAPLKALTQLALAGPIKTQGQFVLAPDTLDMDGQLSLIKSQLQLLAHQDGDNRLQLTTQGQLLLTELTQLLQQPNYASGTLNITGQAELPNWHAKLADNLNANLSLDMNNGLLMQAPMQAFLPLSENLPFTIKTRTKILDGNSLTHAKLESQLAQLTLDNLRYAIGQEQITSDYQLTVPDLSRLVFLTKTPLQGDITMTGTADYTFDKQLLNLTANSNTLGGKVEATVKNKQLHARWQDLAATELSRLLKMSPIFKSRIDGTLDYALAEQQGKFSAELTDGQILPNDMSLLLNQAAKFDITREVYKTVTTQGTINQGVIIADLSMHSNLTQLTSQGARIDLNQQQVDMRLNSEIQGLTLPLDIHGPLTHPTIGTDMGTLLQHKAEQSAQDALRQEQNKLQQQFKLPKLF